ncbi:MAG: YigZ family protein [Clostridia bacterium]|nr:YigZ family protein [Clostridia bacterium]
MPKEKRPVQAAPASEEYQTVRQRGSAEFTVNRSRFIGHIAPVSSMEEAAAFVQEIRAKYPDARHNVFAYIVREPQYSRYSDDGEPQGTAGMPVLDVIRKFPLTDCCVVVTRYFGGILLGTGGLVRAYSQAAKIAVEAGEPVRMRRCRVLELDCPYGQYERIVKLLEAFGAVTEDTAFADVVKIRFRLPLEQCEGFEEKLTDLSGGAIRPRTTGERFDAFRPEETQPTD